jgi:hypothetical protein
MTRGSSSLPTESKAPFDGDEDRYDSPSPRDCLSLLDITKQIGRDQRGLLVSVTLPTSVLERLTHFPPALLRLQPGNSSGSPAVTGRALSIDQ